MDARCSVGAPGPVVNRANLLGQHGVLLCSLRRLSVSPRVVATGGDTQHVAHGDDGKFGLVRAYEFENRCGIECVSRANDGSATNQAAAFARISRSCCRRRFSLRRRRSSSRSADVSPSVRVPASRSTCLIQLRMVCSEGSNSVASSPMERPALASSIICRRNAGGVGWACSWHGDLFSLDKGKIVHQTGLIPPQGASLSPPLGEMAEGQRGPVYRACSFRKTS